MPLISDRLGELLQEHEFLYGVICRDATLTDIELMAQAGYHIVWLDLEHCPQSVPELIRLTRTVNHLGMVPLVRVPELLRTNVQPLVDGGVQIVALPDVRDADQAALLVQLGKYPPLGQRGVATTSAGTAFQLGPDPLQTLREANDATRMMVIFENDAGYENLKEILAVPGIDIVTVGRMDWSTSLGLSGDEAREVLAPKIERVLTATMEADKIPVMAVSSPEHADPYVDLGVRVFFVGVDIALKRRTLVEMIEGFQGVLGGGRKSNDRST